MARTRSRFGKWNKHIELFDLWESFNEDPAVQEAFREELDELTEGTGAIEGRADFPIFLQTVIRNRMRERWRSVTANWPLYFGDETARDFREHTTTQLNGIRGIKNIPEGHEYGRMHSSEEVGPSFAVAKYGGTYGVTMSSRPAGTFTAPVVHAQIDTTLRSTST